MREKKIVNLTQSKAPSAPDAVKLDGRRERTTRTRRAIAEAILALTEEGIVNPSRQEIARRAGVSLRSIFQHSPNMGDFVQAGLSLLVGQIQHRAPSVATDQPLEIRIQGFLDQRLMLLERLSPLRRAANVIATAGRENDLRFGQIRQQLRQEIELWFEPELALLPTGQRPDHIAALAALTDWEMWDNLTGQRGLPMAHARRLLVLILNSVLARRPGEADRVGMY